MLDISNKDKHSLVKSKKAMILFIIISLFIVPVYKGKPIK